MSSLEITFNKYNIMKYRIAAKKINKNKLISLNKYTKPPIIKLADKDFATNLYI